MTTPKEKAKELFDKMRQGCRKGDNSPGKASCTSSVG